MQTQHTTITRTAPSTMYGAGTWIWSHGERYCYSCGTTIEKGESHVGFGPFFQNHLCEQCATGIRLTCQACGDPTPDGGCDNLYCAEGLANIQAAVEIDYSVEDYFLAMDR